MLSLAGAVARFVASPVLASCWPSAAQAKFSSRSGRDSEKRRLSKLRKEARRAKALSGEREGALAAPDLARGTRADRSSHQQPPSAVGHFIDSSLHSSLSQTMRASAGRPPMQGSWGQQDLMPNFPSSAPPPSLHAMQALAARRLPRPARPLPLLPPRPRPPPGWSALHRPLIWPPPP